MDSPSLGIFKLKFDVFLEDMLYLKQKLVQESSMACVVQNVKQTNQQNLFMFVM